MPLVKVSAVSASWLGRTCFKFDSNVGRGVRISLPINSWQGITPVVLYSFKFYDALVPFYLSLKESRREMSRECTWSFDDFLMKSY